MTGTPASPGASAGSPAESPAARRILVLFSGLVALVALIVWPSFVSRLQYARTRGELQAIRDAATVAELAPVGKLFTTLARLIGPTVVNVTAQRRLLVVADEIAALRGTPPQGATGESFGSGVIVDTKGVIVTNYHVVARSDAIVVTLADGRRFVAELVGADAATDIAVLRIDAQDLPVAEWGDSDQLEVGEMVWAIGSPFGLDRTLTYGIVSAIGRRGVTGNPLQEFLQTDAAINPGNSGGPLVDVHGRIVGITTAIIGREYSGIGFAIPGSTARKVCEEILATGHVERGYVGMALRPLSRGGAGAEVVAVERRSPAALAGLQPGDVVVSFAGEPVADPAALVLQLTRAEIGSEVELGLIREGQETSLAVRIARRPRDQ
jgi:serine protease Do